MVAKMLQRPALVLNRNWQPVNVATVARALVLLWNESARVVDPTDYQLYTWEDWSKLRPRDDERFIQAVRFRLSDSRIVSCDDRHVTFRYRRSGSRRWRKMTLRAEEFVRRFLQHVLPRGLQKVRHYGFLSANARSSIESIKWLVATTLGLLYWLARNIEARGTSQPPILCNECGQPMWLISVL